ncbi:AlkZ family DNA glycosylase [Paenibacillus athensensis]|nr:AlkZ family DNA glycosylase [Paenibacillus athensensis]
MPGGSEGSPLLDVRALNRALLARQLLLERVRLPVIEVVERLAGLQAQATNAPYYALWARVEGFRQEQLSELIRDKQVVRMALMRATLHLSSASDALLLRPWLEPVMVRSLKGVYGKQLQGADLEQLAAAGRELLTAEPMTLGEAAQRLGERWPELAADAIAAAVRNRVPLVQVPPRGIWGEGGQAAHTPIEAWLGQPLCREPEAGPLLRRYLAAFGPASVKDMQMWSGMTGIQKIVDGMRSELAVFRDESGHALFDLPEAPRPDADTPVAPRFLGEFDNILLSHADRGRIVDEAVRRRVFTVNGIIRPTILVDGFVAGIWKILSERGRAVLSVEPFAGLAEPVRAALAEEGLRLLRFAEPDAAAYEVSFQAPPARV